MDELCEKISQLNQQAWLDRNKEVQKSLELAQQVQGMLEHCPNPSMREGVISLRTQAYCLEHLSRYGEALTTALKVMELALQLGDLRIIASIDNVLGSIYWRLADHSASLEHYLHGLELTKIEPDPEDEIFLVQGLGLVHHEMGDYEEALKYYQRSIKLASPEDIMGEAIALNNIAYILHEMKRDEEALPSALKALELFGNDTFSVGKLESLHTLGSIYFALGDIECSFQYFEQGVQTAAYHKNPLQMINALFGVCQILQFRGELEAVQKKLLQIIQISKEIGSLASQSSAHQMLAKIYKQWERYQPALEHYEIFHAIHVQMFNEQSERRLQNARVLLEVETLRKQANLYRSLAATDALTGLLSRREFFELGEKALTNYRRLPVSLLMIDVDHFKSINDQRGHSVGDQVLAMVARRLKSALRQDDLAGRYGGDEFVILMPETSLPACQKVAERCCKVITEEPFQIDALILQMSISVGLATLETDRVLRLEALIQRADEALLLAKQNGRNRVVTSGSV